MGNIKRILSGLTFRVFGGRFECGGVSIPGWYVWPFMVSVAMRSAFHGINFPHSLFHELPNCSFVFVSLSSFIHSVAKCANHDFFHLHWLHWMWLRLLIILPHSPIVLASNSFFPFHSSACSSLQSQMCNTPSEDTLWGPFWWFTSPNYLPRKRQNVLFASLKPCSHPYSL